MRPIYFLIPLALLFLVTGCSRDLASIQKMDQLPPKEAFVFGKLRVLINGKDVTPYSNLMIRNGVGIGSGTVKQLVVGNDGVICAGLPAGNTYLWQIYSNKGIFSSQYFYKFGPSEATLQLPQAGGAYYIGDITIDWTPVKEKSDYVAALIMGGLIGVAIMPYSSGNAIITVRDNQAENQKLFRERLQSDKILVPAFLQLKANQTSEKPPTH